MKKNRLENYSLTPIVFRFYKNNWETIYYLLTINNRCYYEKKN